MSTSDSREASPEVEEGHECVCPYEVRHARVEHEQDRFPLRERKIRYPADRNYTYKVDRELKHRCPGDVAIREGEYAKTIAQVTEMYPYKSPMEIAEEDAVSLGSLEENDLEEAHKSDTTQTTEDMQEGAMGGSEREPVAEPNQEEKLGGEDLKE